jgi:hypothetical protein
MNTSFFPFLAIALPLGCFLAAAWPLLLSRRVRPALLGAGGSTCVGLGATVVGLIASGILQLPGTMAQAAADEKTPDYASSQSWGAMLEPTSTTAERDPAIEAAQDTVEIPPGRPKWVGAESNLRGKVHTIPVSSGPYATDSQSRRALDEALVKATNDYISDQLGSELAPKLLRYDARAIKERFIKPESHYHDVARYSVGWMHENFALLEFGPDFRNELDRRWSQVRATSRLAQTGLLSGGVIMLLGSIFGYFRLDNATRGYYTGRLQFMTAAAILAVVGAGAVLAQWIHWL